MACTLFFFVITVDSAFAHSPVLWCYVEDGRVHVEAFFMGGAKIQNGKIYVVDKDGNKLLEGKTNEKGLFDFVSPVKDDITILLRIDSGHSADFTIKKQDFIDAEKEKQKGVSK
jgi:nickel transport protein